MSSIADTARSQSAGKASLDPKALLIGTWRLLSAEDQDPTTKKWVPYTFGNPPSGYFIYGASGYASVQIMTTPPVQLSNPNDGPTPAEALALFNGYIAYYGPWTADETSITVVPEGNLNPTQLGEANPQTRPYQLNGDLLTIGSKAAGYIRTLQRVS